MHGAPAACWFGGAPAAGTKSLKSVKRAAKKPNLRRKSTGRGIIMPGAKSGSAPVLRTASKGVQTEAVAAVGDEDQAEAAAGAHAADAAS